MESENVLQVCTDAHRGESIHPEYLLSIFILRFGIGDPSSKMYHYAILVNIEILTHWP